MSVSILVLVEVLPWARHRRESHHQVPFQSLFWWKYCPGPEGCKPGLFFSLKSFNPCSGGSIALGLIGRARQWLRFETLFQSLFWWKYCPGPGVVAGAPLIRINVSILVLVEVLPWGPMRLPAMVSQSSFQSLFWWKYCPGDGSGMPVGVRPLKFQSLFWWKYCPGQK